MSPTEASPSPVPTPPPTPPGPSPPAVVPAPSQGRRWFRRAVWAVVLLALLILGLVPLTRWVRYRLGHSITDDAFIEAHIINVAPEMVSGRIVRFLVDENDTVERGQVLAEIDPIPYRDKVSLAAAKLDSAKEELVRQQADLERLRREVPIQIEIARRTLAAAVADRRKAEESLKLTDDDVEQRHRRGPRGCEGRQGRRPAGPAGVQSLHEPVPPGGRGPATVAGSDAVA